MSDNRNSFQNAPQSNPLTLTTKQVAVRLITSTKTVHRLVSSGKLSAFQIAGRGPLRFRPTDVDRLLVPIQNQDNAEDLSSFIATTVGKG